MSQLMTHSARTVQSDTASFSLEARHLGFIFHFTRRDKIKLTFSLKVPASVFLFLGVALLSLRSDILFVSVQQLK